MSRRMLVLGVVLLLTAGMWAQGAGKKEGAAGAKKSAAKAAEAAKPAGGAESMLVEMENKWVAASLKSDPAGMGSMLADNYVSMGADGTYQTKKEYLDHMAKSKWTKSELSEVKAQVHGNYAHVTGIWHGEGTDGTGKKVNTTERWIDTFTKSGDGTWKAISSGSTTVK